MRVDPAAGHIDTAYTVTISSTKIFYYLLNEQHPDGASKAKFFLSYGFESSKIDEMVRALGVHLSKASVSLKPSSLGFGNKLQAIGPISTPDGRSPTIRSIWMWTPPIVDPTSAVDQLANARFVTAYPHRERPA